MMPGVNYVTYGCFFARTTPRVSLYRSLTGKYCCSYYSRQGDRWWQFEKQIKNQTLCTCRLFLLA